METTQDLLAHTAGDHSGCPQGELHLDDGGVVACCDECGARCDHQHPAEHVAYVDHAGRGWFIARCSCGWQGDDRRTGAAAEGDRDAHLA